MNLIIIILFIFVINAFIYVEELQEKIENMELYKPPSREILKIDYPLPPSLYTTIIERPYEVSIK